MRGREIGADMAFEATHGGGTGDTGTGLEAHRHLCPTVCIPPSAGPGCCDFTTETFGENPFPGHTKEAEAYCRGQIVTFL